MFYILQVVILMAEEIKNTGLLTSFNTAPYFDDYDFKKNYYRILYKPSLAVQVRELNQEQEMTYQQIKRFADHIFVEGTLALGGQVVLDDTVSYLKIEDFDYLGIDVNVENFRNRYIYSETTGVRAFVLDVAGATTVDGIFEPKTLFIKYVSSGYDNETKTFFEGETLREETTNASVTILVGEDPVGNSLYFKIKEGTIYAKGYFINFPEMSVIAGKYTNKPSCQIGFIIEERIVDYIEDATLKDNANNARNFDAPGADRLQLIPHIKVLAPNVEDPDFKRIYDIDEGIIREKYTRTQYSIIMDELAKRTYDQSGSYVIHGLQTKIREHLDNGENSGWKTLADGGDSNKLAIGVEAGLAYVFGYEVEPLVTSYIPVNKGIDTYSVKQQVVSANYGYYVVLNEFMGAWDFTSGATVNLYDAAQRRITNNTASTTNPSGNRIGTAKVRAVEYDSGIKGTPSAQYRVYLYDINLTNQDFKSVKSLYMPQTGRASGVGDVVQQFGVSNLKESSFSNSIFTIGSSNIKSLRGTDGAINTTFTYLRRFDVAIGTSGTFSITTASTNNIFPYGVGNLNNTQKTEILVSVNNNAKTVALTGQGTSTAGQKLVTGTGTSFTTQISIGDRIEIGGNVVGVVSRVISNSQLELVANATVAANGAIKKVFLAGDIINMSGRGMNGDRNINIDTVNSMSLIMNETLEAAIQGTVICKVNKTTAREARKNVKKNRFVLISAATSGKSGSYNLGLVDVYKINYVKIFDSRPSTEDVEKLGFFASNYTLDNGQRDNYYEHARININSTINDNSWIVINLDYFEHDLTQGQGYFSVDSYPIDDVDVDNPAAIQTAMIPDYVSTSSGIVYPLRDSIDTRFSKVNTANDSETVEGASVSPATTNEFNQTSVGMFNVAPNTNFIMDLEFYLGRKDRIVINAAGEVRSVSGVPAINPITPPEPNDCMTLSILTVAPYPSLPSEVAKKYNRLEYSNSAKQVYNNRFTMRDIGVLQNRISNLEYYTSLSLLEKDTMDMKITDADGLDRFKNGILVDPFGSHKVGDYTNPDYKIAIDPMLKEMRPTFKLNNIKLKLASHTGMVQTGSLVTLPFTSKSLVEQPYATNARNLAGAMYKFIGEMRLDPQEDYWTDTTRSPDIVINDSGDLDAWNSLADAWGTQWGDWQTSWTGTPQTSVSSTTSRSGNNMATTTTTTVTTESGQERQGTQLNVSSKTETQNYGDRIVDMSLIPYMRAITIKVYAYGIKPNTRLYAFFDGEDVSEYMVPASPSFTMEGKMGDKIISTNDGDVYALFMLPSDDKKSFRKGSKVLRLTDSMTNSSETGLVTTAAESTFTSEGIAQTKQSTIVSTQKPIISTNTVSETRTVKNSSTSTNTSFSAIERVERSGGGDPVAQTFIADFGGETQGGFLTQIDLFFRDKDPEYGVTVELREVDSASAITSWVVPYSKTAINSGNINISDDGSVPTTFKFESPVYVEQGTEYAVVVKPVADNANTTIYSAKLSERDLATDAVVTVQPYTGVLYISSNDNIWTPVMDETMKFNLYYAEFTGTNGTVTLSNDDYEFVELKDVENIFQKGELIECETRLKVVSANTALANGYRVVGQISGAEAIISSSNQNGDTVYVYNKEGEFISSEICNIFFEDDLLGTFVITDILSPIAELEYLNNNTAYLKGDGTATFYEDSHIRGMFSGATARVAKLINPEMNTIQFEPSYLTFSNTNVDWTFRGTNTNSIADSGSIFVNVKDNTDLEEEKIVLSKSNETSGKSVTFTGRVESFSKFISPVIDTKKSNLIFVKNIINNKYDKENEAHGGEALARYITKKVTLAEDQDAEDLVVYIGGYRPPSTNIKLYYKILHAEDSSRFDDLLWEEMEEQSKMTYSSKADKYDMREMKFGIPANKLTGTNAEVQYTNPDGIVFTGFKYFSIKVVLLSDNTSLVPRCKDLRAIALQK